MVVLDQFYTTDTTAKKYYDIVKTHVNIDDYDILLEPSAGKGAFLKLFPNDKREGVDLDPKFDGIVKQDFFDYKPKNKKYLVIGNPPFGVGCSIAVKFFNHAAKFADTICFIIPRTFKRISIQNQLDLNFQLIHTEDLPLKPCCFEPKMDAKCCFQIWKKNGIVREIVTYDKTHVDFEFVKYGPIDDKKQPTVPIGADFALKAYGSNCGEIVDSMGDLRPKSWHFIKSNIDIELLKSRFKQLDYSISKDSCRQDSLGKSELIHLYKSIAN